MNIKKHFQTILKEIDAYHSHSLFAEAMKKCEELATLIRQNKRIKNRPKYLSALSKKIKELNIDARKFDEIGKSVQMSAKEQAIVKKLFSSSIEEGTDSAVMEGAVALLVFGQFEGALAEFSKLTKNDSLRVASAKNIIRCHIGLNSMDDAVAQYQRWFYGSQFSPEQLEKIHPFLQGILNKRGIVKSLPKPKLKADVRKHKLPREKFIDILSVVITPDEGPLKQKDFELDVSFQRNNIINVIIKRKHMNLIDYLEVGTKIADVQFNSYDTILFDTCIVTEKNRIRSGPQMNNYALTMKILFS